VTENETHKVIYEGSPAMVGLFAQLLREQGVEAEYEPPIEERGIAETIEAGVIVYMTTRGAEAAIKLAIKKLRERFPKNQVTIEDDTEPEPDDEEQ
jgi:hypothetical protein